MSLKGTIRKLRDRARYLCASAFTKIGKKAVFESFHGKSYSDNPRAVSEKMHELYPDWELVWGMEDPDCPDLPDYVKAYKTGSFAYLRELASAAAYVRNEAMTDDLFKRPGQTFVQTWHGDRGFKKILYDARPKGQRGSDVMDGELTDLFAVGSEYAAKRIRSAFAYEGEVIRAGCPRNDCLLAPSGTEEVKKKIGIPEGKKILIYAPTLRKGRGVIRGAADIDETLRHLSKDGDEWVCLVRAHPKSAGISVTDPERVIDVSRYPDMSDLLMISDMLLTDYSSCAGDFILRRKPVILAQFDRDQYVSEERDFFTRPEDAGFLTAKDQEELNGIIDAMSDEAWAENCEKILDFFGTCETGHAAEAVAKAIAERYTAG